MEDEDAPTQSDDTQATDEESGAGEQPPASEKSFSQKDVDRIVQERLAKERRRLKAERDAEEQTPKGAKDKSKGKSKAAKEDDPEAPRYSETDLRDIIRRERALERAAERAGLSDAQRDVMVSMMDVEQPDDVGEWVDGFVERMAWAKNDTPKPAAQPSETPAAAAPEMPPEAPRPKTPPASGSPSPKVDAKHSWLETGNPNDMTRADKEALIREKGETEAYREITRRAEKWLQHRPVAPPSRR